MKGFLNKMLRLPFGLYLQFNSRANNNEKNVLFFFADIFTQNSFAQENLSWQGYFHTQRSKICQHQQHKFLQLLKMLYSPRISQQT
jgi:hypothetical protein